jgi:cytidine deaminase
MKKFEPIENLDKRHLRLLKHALAARKRAYAPYSKYLVGCAIQDNKGKIHTGCNVENASYGASVCAERVAIGKMVSRSSREITRLVVVTSSEDPVFPCGLCLQVIAEFGKKAKIIAVNRRGTLFQLVPFEALFPQAFSPEKLNG